ncbi:MAG TPA: elongation factor G [Candidatus Acidoferrales bacterium]|nr:elongation factor G [Candidatus Acidoferrales bacterium]
MSELARRRNVAVVGSHHAGKTTLVEAILAECGAVARRGSVTDGTTTTDYEPECVDRGQSTCVGFAYAVTPALDLTLIDCPGYIDFLEETKLALLAADAAVVVLEADPSRIKQIRSLVESLDERKMPHCFFLNKLERPGSDFQETLRELIATFGNHVVAETIPIGEADDFRGYVDLPERQAFVFEEGRVRTVPLGADLEEPVRDARTKLLEALGDFDDHLLEELLEGIEPPLEEIRSDLRSETTQDQIVPVLVGSAQAGIGVSELLGVIERQFPAPSGDPNAPLVVQIAKTMIHPQSGKLSVGRLFAGSLSGETSLVNVSRGGVPVKTGALYRLQGRRQDIVTSAQAGDVVAFARLDGVQTGDTLASDAQRAARPSPALAEPLFALAIKPKEKLDEAKLSQILTRILEEDPTLRVERAPFTGELQLLGLGEVHVTTALARLGRKYHLALEIQAPGVAYRETIAKSTEVHARYKHQTGGHGQFADVVLRIEPRDRDHGITFEERIVGGAVPRQFFPAIEKGVREALMRGPVAGYPVVDAHITLIDGAYHSVDSSEQAFRTAVGMAIRDGLPKCAPVLLEPIVLIEAIVPDESASTILGGISGKRGHVLTFEPSGTKGFARLRAHAPQAEVGNYITELRTATSGLGTYTWKHQRFDPVPAKVAQAMREAVPAG